MQDLYNNIDYTMGSLDTLAGSPGNVTASVDLQGYEALDVIMLLGDMDELGSSPVGRVTADVTVEATAAERTAAQLWTDVMAQLLN